MSIPQSGSRVTRDSNLLPSGAVLIGADVIHLLACSPEDQRLSIIARLVETSADRSQGPRMLWAEGMTCLCGRMGGAE